MVRGMRRNVNARIVSIKPPQRTKATAAPCSISLRSLHHRTTPYRQLKVYSICNGDGGTTLEH
jgi:hypothetical protein